MLENDGENEPSNTSSDNQTLEVQDELVFVLPTVYEYSWS